jgi:hypothetical protein
MNDIISAFKGKKTYLVSAFIAFCVFAHQVGWIDQETFQSITILLTGAGFAALRAGGK